MIGLPGAGKTTVGREISRGLGWTFIDLDQQIADAAGRDIPSIFRREGEAGFRSREERALREVAGPDRVVALGGGVVCRRMNRRRLSRRGSVVWLDVPVDVARGRCTVAPGSRPVVAVLSRQPRRLARRLALYAELGHRIDAAAPVCRVVQAALDWLSTPRHP
ncbi:MAG: shikimate kinase [Acidobacteriota bacterium]